MTALLEDRVAAWLADHPNTPFLEILRAVPCQTKTLEAILQYGPFEEREGRWRIAGTSGKRRRRTAKSHKARVLELLADGRPHSHMEGYRLNVMLHSRVADLRRDGYRIDCWCDKGLYWYRMALGSATGSAVAEPSGRVKPQGGVPAAQTDGQLVLADAEFRRGAV